jgi:phosphate transport system protein
MAPPLTRDEFIARTSALHARLTDMGQMALRLVETALSALYSGNRAAADGIISADDAIDAIDIEIERTAVTLLSAAAATSIDVPPDAVRHLLVIVKANNEIERIADAGSLVAELTLADSREIAVVPATTRVMTNSVVGVLRDSLRCLSDRDAHLARIVLASEHVVARFRIQIIKQAQAALAAGNITADTAFMLHELTSAVMLIADHATNIAEQVIYAEEGTIVRHGHEQWDEKAAPERE